MAEVKQTGTIFGEHELRKARDGVRGQFLTNTGFETGLYYTHHGGLFSIWRFGTVARLADCFFGNHAVIVGACYMPFKDGSEGIVIAVNDHSGNHTVSFIAYYSVAKGKIIKTVRIRKEITCVATILDNTKSRELDVLHANLRSSPHLVAVGTERACCYLVHFGVDSPDECDPTLTNAPFTTDICKKNKSDNVFIIRSVSGEKIHVETDSLSVTAIQYVEVCKLVVIGLSCGAFVTVNLADACSEVYYFSKGPVFSIAYQQANDDPQPVIYLWFAHSAITSRQSSSSHNHAPHVMLVRIDFPYDENSGVLTKPFIQRPHLTWPPDRCSRWLSFRTVCQKDSFERSNNSSCSIHEGRSPTVEGSVRNGCGVDTSLLLMTWVDITTATAEGAIFDLNAFYYKRLIPRVLFDSTIAHQNAFISRFTLASPKQVHLGFPLDVMASASSICRFESPLSDANDALFYASSLAISLDIITATHTFGVSIHSIQEEVLNFAESNIEKVMNGRPCTAAEWITAVGLANANSTIASNSENVDASVVVSALIYHRRGRALKNWVEETRNKAAKSWLAKQLWDEVEHSKSRFDELSSSLFGSLANDLSRAAVVSMGSTASLVSIAAELFGCLASKADTLSSTERAELECHHRASSNLALYSRLVLFFWQKGLLPEASGFRKHRDKLRENFDRCATMAKKNREVLWISALLEEMHLANGDDTCRIPGAGPSWYPPRSLLTLLAQMLVLQIVDVAKYKLIGYFLLDYDHVCDDVLKVFDSFKYSFIQNDTALAEQICDKWKRDHGMQLEKTRKVDEYFKAISTSSSSDLRSLMDCPLLDRKQLAFIREKMLSMKDGVTLWNAFCMKRKYFDHLIPPTGKPGDEQWKVDCDRWAMKVISLMPRRPEVQLPESVVDKWRENRSSVPSRLRRSLFLSEMECKRSLQSPLVDRGRVMASRKRTSTGEQTSDVEAAEVSGERKNQEELRSDTEPFFNSPVLDDRAAKLEKVLSETELESVRRVLQTPPSRRRMLRGTALLGESPVSPFVSLPMPPPASILKSNKRKGLLDGETDEGYTRPSSQTRFAVAGSEQRHRLRFDLPSGNTSTSVDSPVSENDGASSTGCERRTEHSDFNYESGEEEGEIVTVPQAGDDWANGADVEKDDRQQQIEAKLASTTAMVSQPIPTSLESASEENDEVLSTERYIAEMTSDDVVRSFEEQEGPEEVEDVLITREPARVITATETEQSERKSGAELCGLDRIPSQPIAAELGKPIFSVYEEQEWESEEQLKEEVVNHDKMAQVSSVDISSLSHSRFPQFTQCLPEEADAPADRTFVVTSRSFEEQTEEDLAIEDDVPESKTLYEIGLAVPSVERDRSRPGLESNVQPFSGFERQPESVIEAAVAPERMDSTDDDRKEEGELVYRAVTYQVIEQQTESEVIREYSFEEQEWTAETDIEQNFTGKTVQIEESRGSVEGYERELRKEEQLQTEREKEPEMEKRVFEVEQKVLEVERQGMVSEHATVKEHEPAVLGENFGRAGVVQEEPKVEEVSTLSTLPSSIQPNSLNPPEENEAAKKDDVADIPWRTKVAGLQSSEHEGDGNIESTSIRTRRVIARSGSAVPSSAPSEKMLHRRSHSESAATAPLANTRSSTPLVMRTRPKSRLRAGRKSMAEVLSATARAKADSSGLLGESTRRIRKPIYFCSVV
ncbi:Protein ELYS [Toxocara canis]|uniref:Protein ELYS n=1 Tax=Toxocara canis TaxID=6265 RepID=A0A0B2VV17_TOXCA|nr:Protein ELYS [Toxocara canis]